MFASSSASRRRDGQSLVRYAAGADPPGAVRPFPAIHADEIHVARAQGPAVQTPEADLHARRQRVLEEELLDLHAVGAVLLEVRRSEALGEVGVVVEKQLRRAEVRTRDEVVV